MTTDTFTLTDIERACGVTIEAVTLARRVGLVFDNGTSFMAKRHEAPALAGAAARMALGGPVDFSHLTAGCPVYVLAGAR